MRPTLRTRRIAAVLAVVFLLTAVWAAYYLYSEVKPPTAGGNGTAVVSYSESSTGSFVAQLVPSVLYDNATEISGGNITLFSSITKTINVSLNYTLTFNRTVQLSVVEIFGVTLSTPAWSKPLLSNLTESDLGAVTSAQLSFSYEVNVTQLLALAQSIDTQVAYNAAYYTLSLTPEVSPQVSVGSLVQVISGAFPMNFTFSGSTIAPAGLSHSDTGTIYGPAGSVRLDSLAVLLPAALLVGSVGSLGGSTWVATRRPAEERTPPLAELIQPYQEVIANTARPPKEALATPVGEFTDLVKIADTLGKPILRPVGPDHDTFYVLDGLVAYEYRYPGVAPRTTSSADSAAEPTATAPEVSILLRRLQEQSGRVRALHLDAEKAGAASQQIRHILDLIQVGSVEEAARELDGLTDSVSAWAAESARRGA